MIREFKLGLLLLLVMGLGLAPTLETVALGTVSEPVQTLAATSVADSSVTLNGMLSIEGADERGFEYGFFDNSYDQTVISGGNAGYSNWVTIGGAYGDSSTQFMLPHSIAVDSIGNIYVTDNAASKVKKYDPSGNFILQWGTQGSADGQLYGPLGVSADSNNNVYVVDYLNSRIQKFDSTGNFIAKWGSAGSGNGQFTWPTSIHVNNSYVYVGDYRRIQRFDLDGNFQLSWESYGNGCCWLHPEGIATDSFDNVYVAHNHPGGTYSIQKFDADGGSWSQFVAGSVNGPIGRPSGIDVDELDNIYVSDYSYRVHKFNSSATLIVTWGDAGSSDRFQPYGLAYNSGYGLYLADAEGIEGTTRVIAMNNRPSVDLTDLACGSEYNYRAYAKYGDQTFYGQNRTFVTEEGDDCEDPVNPPSTGSSVGGSSAIVPGVPRAGKMFGFVAIVAAISSLAFLAYKEHQSLEEKLKTSAK
jgi:hypothetical protein